MTRRLVARKESAGQKSRQRERDADGWLSGPARLAFYHDSAIFCGGRCALSGGGRFRPDVRQALDQVEIFVWPKL